MNLHWALYDPSHLSSEKSYWTWHSPALTTPLLERFYYDIASKNLPSDPNALTEATFLGGLAAPVGKWAVAYRFLDGGRDRQGRPGRFVLLVAWMDADAINGGGYVLKNVFSHQTFRDVELIAKTTIPIPAPVELSTRLAESCPAEKLSSQHFPDSKIFDDACGQFSASLTQSGMHMLLSKKGVDFQVKRIELNLESGKGNSADNHRNTVTNIPQPKKNWVLPGALILVFFIVLLGVGVYFRFPKIIFERIKVIMQIQADENKSDKREEEALPHSQQPDVANINRKAKPDNDVVSKSNTEDTKWE